MRMNIIMATSMLIGAAVAFPALAGPIGDEQAVRSVLATYLAGENGDDASLRAAFHPEGHVYFVGPQDGKYARLDREGYAGFVQNVGRNNPKTMEVLSIDISGTSAMARVVLTGKTPPVTITDYLGLLKVNGAWTITSRIASIRAGE